MAPPKKNNSLSHYTCTKCKETKSRAEFWISGEGRVLSRCKHCLGQISREWSKKNIKERLSKQAIARCKRKYGLTDEEYRALILVQGGVCSICKKPPHAEDKKDRRFAVDHCHKTGVIRGILCSPCNLALGLLEDNPDFFSAAIQYLEDTKPIIQISRKRLELYGDHPRNL